MHVFRPSQTFNLFCNHNADQARFMLFFMCLDLLKTITWWNSLKLCLMHLHTFSIDIIDRTICTTTNTSSSNSWLMLGLMIVDIDLGSRLQCRLSGNKHDSPHIQQEMKCNHICLLKSLYSLWLLKDLIFHIKVLLHCLICCN